MWQHWANFILGLLVVIFAYMGGDHVLRFVVLGLLIAIVSIWGALAKRPVMA